MADEPIAHAAYQALADAYAARVDTKPHNAYYEQPATLSLLPDITGARVLECGCGPGASTEALLARGATVVACDASERMLAKATTRLGDAIDTGRLTFHHLDLGQPLDRFDAQTFDVVFASLCFDYIEDWRPLFRELHRVLAPGGTVVFSCGHPAFDAEYFETEAYFSVERVACTWTGFGVPIVMPSFRRSLEEIVMPLVEAGFALTALHEPLPTEAFRAADPKRYARLMRRPGFLCVAARKPQS